MRSFSLSVAMLWIGGQPIEPVEMKLDQLM